jgi:cation diffusion facilitator family transporter
MSQPEPAGESAASTTRRGAAVRAVLLRILVFNLIVAVIKGYVGVRSGSLAVLGAALESLLDMLNNVGGMIAVTVAAREPDEDHPYGHGKFETLGALAIVGFLSISCFELLRQAIGMLLRGESPPPADSIAIGLLSATAVINILVVWYERKVGRALGSTFLLADAEHTRADIYVTVLALASLGLTRVGLVWADAALAIVVAGLIARSGVAIIRNTVPVLVDERAVDAERIREIVRQVPRIREVRSVRSRSGAAGVLFADITITVDGSLPVAAAHELTDAIEARVEAALGASEVIVHVEPA